MRLLAAALPFTSLPVRLVVRFFLAGAFLRAVLRRVRVRLDGERVTARFLLRFVRFFLEKNCCDAAVPVITEPGIKPVAMLSAPLVDARV